MNKFYLPVFIFLALFFSIETSYAQSYFETEPNNSFATAGLLKKNNDTLGASIGGADAIDHFIFELDYFYNLNYKSGTIVLNVSVTNTGTEESWIKAEIFNGLEAAGLIHSENINGTVAPGATVNKTIRICGLAKDDYFIAMTTNGNFNYKLHWYYSDPNPNDEPNDSRATAFPITYDTLNSKRQSVYYKYRNEVDTVDFFKTILPAGNYDNVNLDILAKNNSCENGKWIMYALYKNESEIPLETGYIGTPSVASFTEVFTSFNLSDFNQGDSLFIKIWSNAAFGFELKYSGVSIDYVDEVNDYSYDQYSAEFLGQNQLITGQVGYHVMDGNDYLYDEYNDPLTDNYDNYSITVLQDGVLTLNFTARNDDCGYGLYYSILDEFGNEIDDLDYLEIASWWGTCMDDVAKTDKHYAVMAGTYWISIFNGNSGVPDRMSYSLKYNFSPYNSGGQSDPEPNYSNATATPVNEGDTVKGYVRFISSEYDPNDYFKTTMPAESKIRVYLKAIYRGPSEATGSYNTFSFQCQTNGFYRSIPSAPPVIGAFSVNDQQITPPGNENTPDFPIIEFLTSDTVFLDTFVINAVPQGLVYFRITSDEAWEYEFRFEIEDSLTGPNDIEPNNSFTEAQQVLASDTTHGRIRHVVNGASDIYDYFISETSADGKIKVFIEATHTGTVSNPGSDYLFFNVFNGSKASIEGIIVGNNVDVMPGQTVYDTVEICGYAADTIYFRFSGNKKFSYNFRYELSDTVYNNLEPDNNYGQSTVIKGNHTGSGTLGYRKRGVTDNNDYYKIFFGSNDSLKVNVTATNTGCNNAGMRMYVYNKNHSQILNRFISGSNSVAPGEVVSDSFKIAVNAPDTIFVRFESSNPFTYNFSTGPLVPSSFYSIQGDSTVCFGPQVYKAIGVSEDDVTYHWSLPSGGGTITYTDSIATVNWNQSAILPLQLILTNSSGSSTPRIYNVIVNDNTPTQVPVVYNFARNLSSFGIPPGAMIQWYRNGIAIEGANDSVYYAQLQGSYYARFQNDCGSGPVSNEVSFPADAVSQSITSSNIDSIAISPALSIPLQAVSSSGLPVFFQLISGNGQIINDSLKVNARGNFVIKIMQPGDDIYSSAPEIIDTILVVKGDHSVVFHPISSKIYSPGGSFQLSATTTSNSGISYSIVSGNALISGGYLLYRGAGLVTVRAFHSGNDNYNAAAPVDQTFCVGVRDLEPIAGDANPCLATYAYTTNKIPGANYEWTLSGGGILQTNNDTAFVTWQTPGSYILSVRANTGCDTIFTTTREVEITTSDNAPAVVTGMVPANNAKEQQLPLKLSWIPGSNTVSYDLYVWDSASVQPATPFAADINTISFTLPMNSFAYNTTYKWKVISKNPCSQTEGPVQHFRLIPLPDLLVSDVQIPASANSGQTISISWKVSNVGPGRTLTHQKWTDAVFFSADSVLSLNNGISWDRFNWNAQITPPVPLLAGTKPNVQALESGEHYTSSINFTLPQNYSHPIYVFVITDFHKNSVSPLQLSVLNDVAEADSAMDVVLTPTPDLRVDTVFSPSTSFSGSDISLTYKVKNYGALTPHGINWKDSVFISQSPLFNRQTAIPLHLKKPDGSYYPGAVKAAAGISAQLETDSSYTRTLDVVLPNGLFGTWFIYVHTNADKKLYEGPLAENNLNYSQVQIYLTPTPKLVVNTLEVPVSSASITQPFGINWMVKNEGFKDNIEKNKGHIFTMSTCNLPCSGGGGPNTACISIAPSIIKDSLVFGSSYWVDRVYLSTNPNVLDTSASIFVKEVKHGTLNSGLYPPISYCPASASNSLNIENVIEPNGQYAKSANFNIPSNLAEGNYYVYVLTNAKKDVFEYPGTMHYKRSAQPVTIQRPDLFISSLNVPASVTGGQPVQVDYTIQNQGSSVFNHVRRDRLYSSIWPVFDANAVLLETITYTENIPSSGSVAHSFEYTFPHSTSGNRYFYVLTNFDSSFRESNMANNVSAAGQVAVSAALPNDLVITSVSLPDSFYTVFNSPVSYTVKNNGLGTTSGTWTDSLFINCGPVFSNSTSYFIGARIQNRQVQPGESYTDTAFVKTPYTFTMKDCFAESMYANAYFFIKTNADTGAYEASNVNNNVGTSAITPVINPVVDHIFVQTSAQDTLIVGRTFQAGYTLRNMGYNPNSNQLYYFRYEGVYLSPDSVMSNNAIKAKEIYGNYNQINRFEDQSATKSFTAPVVTTGDYYLLFHTDIGFHIKGEILKSNNVAPLRDLNGDARKVHVIRPLLPDLKDSILSAPEAIAVGQPFEVIRSSKNKGLGESYPASFRSSLFLSPDFNISNSSKHINAKVYSKILQPGEFTLDTITGVIPIYTVPGNYVLISHSDAHNDITESDESNNLGFSLVNIFRPEPADLVISEIMHPDTVYLGYTIDSLRYIVNNNAPNNAKGFTKDGIYLSALNLPDSSATLIGILNKNIDMEPVASDTLTSTPLVTGVVEGTYKILVKADMQNNIVESDKDNNTTASAGEIYVKVKELPLHVTEFNTLHDRDRYYKLIIPDSLLGSTIRVRLKSYDSLSMQNEIFIGGGFIPTPAHHDYKFEFPNYGNQQIVMTDVNKPVYYIVARTVSPGNTIQNIELYAEKLPFAILDVNSSSGGNSGNVTVKLNGSLFAPGMTAKLENGTTTIHSSAVYYTNSTIAYATFNLQGKPLGVYDVSLSKGDTAHAILTSAFSVVPTNNGGLITGSGPNTGAGNGNEPGCDPGAPSGLNAQLVAELVVPPKALIGRTILIQIHFSNPTNVDIPAQSRVLYAEEGMKLAFTREGVHDGPTALYIEITEAGGPPGIIRAGGSGTINVYTTAPTTVPQDPKVLIKLK